nr:MAG TPA: hypothetical protein [Caudoviricetes sp.]
MQCIACSKHAFIVLTTKLIRNILNLERTDQNTDFRYTRLKPC